MDPRTVILLCGLMGGLMSLVLYSLVRNYPASIEGLRDWARGMLAWFLSGVAMVLLQGRVPAVVSIVTPNLLVLVGAYLFLLGSQRFLAAPPPRRTVQAHAAVIGGAMVAVLWFTVGEPSYQARITLMAALLLYLFGAHAWLLARHGGRRLSARMAAGVLALLALNHAVRLYTAIVMPAGKDLFDALPQNIAYITLLPVLVLMLAIAMILMASDRLSAELEQLAMRDPLTQALTRRSLAAACELALARCARTGEGMAVLCMDLDFFKAVNDSFGHQAGDRVLQRFVRTANGTLRSTDQLGRFGGEEFVAVLPDTTEAGAVQLAERLRQAWAATEESPRSTVSIGVSATSAGKDTFDSLIGRADAALYRAKAAGRNRTSV